MTLVVNGGACCEKTFSDKKRYFLPKQIDEIHRQVLKLLADAEKTDGITVQELLEQISCGCRYIISYLRHLEKAHRLMFNSHTQKFWMVRHPAESMFPKTS